MRAVRIYSGTDGESHFEDLTPEQLAEVVNRTDDGDVRFGNRPAEYFSNDYHNAPRRQYIVILSGEAQVETADGSARRFFAGDVIVAEDLTGHGHISRGLGREPRMSIAIPLKEPSD